MEKKKLLVLSALLVLAGAAAFYTLNPKSADKADITQENIQAEENIEEQNVISKTDNENANIDSKATVINATATKTNLTQKTDLYNDIPSGDFPLSGISELAGASNDVKAAVKNIIDNSQCIYLVKRHGERLLLITDNPENLRHGVDFVEVSLKTGHQTRTTLGYSDKMQDSNNDYWEFDNNQDRRVPLKHLKYNKDGDIDFIETWNYGNDNNIKYEMKNAEGKVISLRKEVLDGNQNLRVEHLIYDKDGHTKVNVSATYEGADLKRFTYYNADKPTDSGSVYGEYENGLKVKETVYSSDLKVQNVYNASYKDGIREEITVTDGNNNEIGKFLAK